MIEIPSVKNDVKIYVECDVNGKRFKVYCLKTELYMKNQTHSILHEIE